MLYSSYKTRSKRVWSLIRYAGICKGDALVSRIQIEIVNPSSEETDLSALEEEISQLYGLFPSDQGWSIRTTIISDALLRMLEESVPIEGVAESMNFVEIDEP